MRQQLQTKLHPKLPDHTRSIKHFISTLKQKHRKTHWIGGRLFSDFSDSFIILTNSDLQLKCFLSPKACLFFDFENKQKNMPWRQAKKILKPGDGLMIEWKPKASAQNNDILKKSKNIYTIRGIQKIVLVSLYQDSPVLHDINTSTQKKWLSFLKAVEKILSRMGLEKTQTPTLVPCPGTEPDLEVFKTKLHGVHSPRFLATSPEMHLKRLLCRGMTDIYEIKKCFRNNETGPLNAPEFYLLEWYRAYSNLNILIEDLSCLLTHLAQEYKSHPLPQLKKISVKELFQKHCNMNLTPKSSKKDFASQLKKLNIPFTATGDINDLFYLLFLNKIEPHLDPKVPLIIYDYPPFQKAFAKINPKGWASRFELFWKGMELANAFDEVTCPKTQGLRFQADLLQRKKKNKTPVPQDQDLLQDMKKGMPPSSGIALGLERLFLAFTNTSHIRSTRFF